MSDQFRVLINLKHATLNTDDRNGTLAELLEDVARRVRAGETLGTVRDPNGNTVGDFGTRIEGTLP